MLIIEFSQFRAMKSQIKHKTLPPHNEFLQIQADFSLKQFQYLIKHEEILNTQKSGSHPILADYGDDQSTSRSIDSGNDVT